LASKRLTEKKALKLIIDSGNEGLYQTDLWKKLEISGREASRIAIKFEENGTIHRERALNEGRWTFKLFSINKPVTLNSVQGCPCLVCADVDKCFRGGTMDPNVCLKLTAWIDPRIEQVESPTQQ
jgi:hypothetical protein